MKTLLKKVTSYLMITGMLLSSSGISAGDHDSFFTISGIVKDKQNRKKLEYVNISVPGTNIGTVTNADGLFTLKIKDSLQANVVEISHIGYYNYRIPVSGSNISGETFYLTPQTNTLNEIIVRAKDPCYLVEEAINRIGENYSEIPNMLTGFYRETAQKGRRYINISEAVIDIYKTPYTENVDKDRIQVFKGRKLLSQKSGDTLAVKLLGGPSVSVYVDIVKNPDILLDKESISDFRFRMEEATIIDNRAQYVISFHPLLNLPYASYYGTLYIDKESLAFTRAEFFLDMTDRIKATKMILKKKPVDLRFKPGEVSFLVTYKQRNGKSYLNYIRNEVKFKCDWKRKLFSTNYAMVSEIAITERRDKNIENIPYKASFKPSQSLSDRVMDFFDENYWEGYNIIEPTESLESAVTKLKKQQD